MVEKWGVRRKSRTGELVLIRRPSLRHIDATSSMTCFRMSSHGHMSQARGQLNINLNNTPHRQNLLLLHLPIAIRYLRQEYSQEYSHTSPRYKTNKCPSCPVPKRVAYKVLREGIDRLDGGEARICMHDRGDGGCGQPAGLGCCSDQICRYF